MWTPTAPAWRPTKTSPGPSWRVRPAQGAARGARHMAAFFAAAGAAPSALPLQPRRGRGNASVRRPAARPGASSRRPPPAPALSSTRPTRSRAAPPSPSPILPPAFDFRPGRIIEALDLQRVPPGGRFQETAAYGHFGRPDGGAFTWEATKRLSL